MTVEITEITLSFNSPEANFTGKATLEPDGRYFGKLLNLPPRHLITFEADDAITISHYFEEACVDYINLLKESVG